MEEKKINLCSYGCGQTGIKNYLHEKDRIDYFKERGYETLVIWEYELKNLQQLKFKLIEFNNN